MQFKKMIAGFLTSYITFVFFDFNIFIFTEISSLKNVLLHAAIM